jgi:hypothetical protein
MVSPERLPLEYVFYLGEHIGIVMKFLVGVPPRDRSASKGGRHSHPSGSTHCGLELAARLTSRVRLRPEFHYASALE